MPIPESPQPRRASAIARLAREQAKSPSKLRNKRSGKYASIREHKQADYLKVLESQHEIFNLREQVRFEILPPCEGYPRGLTYVADFAYFRWDDVAGPEIVEDVKPEVRRGKKFRTPVYELKKRLMWQLKGIRINEI